MRFVDSQSQRSTSLISCTDNTARAQGFARALVLWPLWLFVGNVAMCGVLAFCWAIWRYGPEFYAWVARQPGLGTFARLCEPLWHLAHPAESFLPAEFMARYALALAAFFSAWLPIHGFILVFVWTIRFALHCIGWKRRS